EGDPEIRAMLPHRRLQRLRCGRANLMVDVESVGARGYRIDGGTEIVQHTRRDVICRTVGAIEHDTQAATVQLRGEGAFAELDVAADGVIDAPCFAEICRCYAFERFGKLALDRALGRIGQLGSAAREKLDSIVVVRIV